MDAALVEEATRRSGLVWLLVDGVGRAQPVWHLWHEGAAYVVCGGGEQPLEGVDAGTRVLVVVRSKDRQADRVVQWWATAQVLAPGGPAWQAVIALLDVQRLNGPSGRAERWARESVVLRLVPEAEEPVLR